MSTIQLAAPRALPLARRASSLVGSVIDQSTATLASQTHDIVRFAMGAPSDDLIPVADLDRIASGHRAGRYGYGESSGEPALVEQIVRLAEHMGAPTARERITVTTGAMQGLDLIARLFVDDGDLVIVEGPTYTNANATMLAAGARLLEAPTDAHGLVVDALPDLVRFAGATPKVVYCVPTFQNPTGSTIPTQRRERLLELVEEWGAVLIDDDPYGMLRFDGEHVPTFAQLSGNAPSVLSVRTFSKLLAPGLRVGWLDVDPSLRDPLIRAKQAMDTCTSVPAQLLVADFLAADLLRSHLDRVIPLYAERKAHMRAALERELGQDAVATDPEGGFFLWLTLTGALADVDAEAAFDRALAEGVAYIPGPAFSTRGAFRNALRLCFATSEPARIDEGVARLARSLHASIA